MLESDRLLLRWHTEEDIEPAYQINLDPEVSRYTLDGGVQTRESIDQIIRNNVFGDYQKYGYGRFAVVYKPENLFIGFAGLKYLPYLDEVDLGYRLARRFWGMGIATEASRMSLEYGFNELDLDRVIAMAHPDNTASINVMQKLGFQFEGNREEEGGTVVCYALNKSEFARDQR